MKITKSNALPWTDAMNKGAFVSKRKELGGVKLTSGLWQIPPGKKSFPLHMHHVTEEALFVISGTGAVRTPDGESPIEPGDYVSFPAGGPAHQVINNGTEALIFLAMGANGTNDIVEYPESKKVSASIGTWPTAKRFLFSTETQLGYFDGEKDA